LRRETKKKKKNKKEKRKKKKQKRKLNYPHFDKKSGIAI